MTKHVPGAVSAARPLRVILALLPRRSRPSTARIVVLIILVVLVAALLRTGHEPLGAVAVAAGLGLVAAEVARRLLGPVAATRG
ncbi:MAG TPA: hypothetical protein VGD67_15945 [Pseudonocardiaceae bacterium]